MPSIFSFLPSREASISTMSVWAGMALSINKTDTFVPVVANMLEGILTTPRSQLLSMICLRILGAMPEAAVINPVGTTIAALPVGLSE